MEGEIEVFEAWFGDLGRIGGSRCASHWRGQVVIHARLMTRLIAGEQNCDSRLT